MPDITDILKRAKPRQKPVWLCLAGDVVAEIEDLERQLGSVADTWAPDSLAATNPAEAIAKKIKSARERMRKQEVKFLLQSLGDKAWSDMVAAHPSADKNQIWDPETFPKAALIACCIDPVMTAEQAEELFAVLNQGQREELLAAAYEVNADATAIPFSVSASGILASIAAS
jgi:hypothetical protein